MRLSIIVPTLDERDAIAATLAPLQALRARGEEVIVVDAGSTDGTAEAARPLADRVLSAARGRARQMNAGAAVATGDVLVFLHADTCLSCAAADALRAELARSAREWGRFDVAIVGRSPGLAVVAALMNARSCLTGIATGDQAIFVRRDVFAALGGYPVQPLMEDVALSRALRRRGPPLCCRARVVTSGRRWDQHGLARTVLLMWQLRWAYWRGADPARLARRYDPRLDGPAR